MFFSGQKKNESSNNGGTLFDASSKSGEDSDIYLPHISHTPYKLHTFFIYSYYK